MVKFITVGSYLDVSRACVSRTKLESFGIPCFIANEHFVGLNWMNSTLVGGVDLQVPEEYAEEAQALLTETTPPTPEEQDPPDICPRCNSSDTERRSDWKRNSALAFLIIGLPIFFSRKEKRCKTCEHTWK